MPRILLVEDDTRLADSMLRALEMRGAEVVWVQNAEDAYWEVRKFGAFDFILTDYDLGPGLTGAQFVNNCTSGAVVILWSGLTRDREVAAECPRRHPDWVLTKDNIDGLLAILFPPNDGFHSCPFQVEIHDNDDNVYCQCTEEEMQNCRDEI